MFNPYNTYGSMIQVTVGLSDMLACKQAHTHHAPITHTHTHTHTHTGTDTGKDTCADAGADTGARARAHTHTGADTCARWLACTHTRTGAHWLARCQWVQAPTMLAPPRSEEARAFAPASAQG